MRHIFFLVKLETTTSLFQTKNSGNRLGEHPWGAATETLKYNPKRPANRELKAQVHRICRKLYRKEVSE